GAGSAHAQGVISRQMGKEPVETTVTQTPNGTVITRRPLAAAPAPVAPALASTTEVDETVGAAPAIRRTTTRTTTRDIRSTRAPRAEHTTRTVTRTAHRRVAAARPLVLDRAQRAVVYRTIVQQRVVPPVAVAPLPPPGYPPYPAPAYSTRTVVVPAETTGYGVVTPAEDVDDVTIAEAPAAYPAAPYPVRYT